MTQSLTAPPPPSTPLFDLLARSWPLDVPITALAMDRAGKTVAFALSDGRIALAALDDAEGAMSRMRREADTGRSTIRPRRTPVAAPILTAPLSAEAPLLAASNRIGFLAACRDGRVLRVTPRGQVIELRPSGQPVTALATDGHGRLALAGDGLTAVIEEERMTRLRAILTPGAAVALAFAPDRAELALKTDGALLLSRQGAAVERLALAGRGPLVHAQGGGWIAGADGDRGFWLLRRSDGSIGTIDGFPVAPCGLAFTAGDRAIFAAGAFRPAGWLLDPAPCGDGAVALRTGRPAPVLVTATAAHPTRDLIAIGWADGAIGITRPGTPDEMALRPADGAAVTVLGWSRCGLHLALGTAAGQASVITLPPQIFK